MKYQHLLALFLATVPTACFSQTELSDSVSVGQNRVEGIGREGAVMIDSISGVKTAEAYHFTQTPAPLPLFPNTLAQPLELHFPTLHYTPGHTKLLAWNGGEIFATGTTRTLSGLMQIDSGAFAFYQSAGNFTFQAGAMVNKYGYFNGLHTQYGLNASLAYQFTPRLSAAIFGEYYFGRPPQMANGAPMPPAMAGYYGRSTFGGYLDFRINERWGVLTGVQTVQQIGSNRYRAEPIVTPYYRISKKVTIGLPVGQILYHILRK